MRAEERQILTEASVAGQLLVRLLHALYVQPAGRCMVHDGFGVVHAYNALGFLLNGVRGIPRLVYVAGRETLQHRQVSPAEETGRRIRR